ncbi:MAG: ABC transporter ATP-binding protein [Chitinophagales bacterium]
MSFWSKLFGTERETKSKYKRQGEAKSLTFKERWKALSNIPKFFRLIWETSPSMTLGNALLRLCKAGIPLTMLYVGKLIIDEVIRIGQVGFEGADMQYLWTIVAIEFGLALFSDLLNRGINLLDALLGDLFANKTSVQLIEHAAQLDLQQFEDATFYDKLERARRQTVGRTVLMSQVLSQVQDIITILFLAAGLVVFNPWLILLLLVAVFPAFLSETYFNEKSYSLTRSWTSERRELDYLRYVGASDVTAKEIKIFGLENFLRSRFETIADSYYEVNKALSIKRAAWGSVFNSLGNGGYYIAYVVIILQAVKSIITVGDLTFLAGSFNRLRALLQGILTRFSSIAQNALYLQDFFDFMEMQPEIVSPEKSRPFPKEIKEGFVFENVGFKYPGTEIWALRHLSFSLKAGEKLALVGENGAGKTTLTKLISRLYDPSEGRILLEGHDLKSYNLKELRQAIGIIFQDFVRFQMTASENIAIGKIEEREDTSVIVHSAEQSLADTVIQKLPEQYEQMLGRRFQGGVELSGGEWQKVALGRAYMRKAEMLILDEPTAALDARAEFEVFQRFADLTKGKMAVLISHRFSTVRMADRILVMQNGEKVELGTHQELLDLDGYYAELFGLQAAGYQ